MINAHSYILPRIYSGASLPNYNTAGADKLTVKPLNAEAFGLTIATVFRATSTFFLSEKL
jgi:hypothetical protein